MNDSTNDSDTRRERARGGSLVAGLILIGLGLCFLFLNFGWIDFDFPWSWWPLVLVAIGGGRLVSAGDDDERRGGAWLVLIGVWLLINVQGWFGLSWHNSWPLVLVAAGLMIAWKGWSPDHGSRRRRGGRRIDGDGGAGAGEGAR